VKKQPGENDIGNGVSGEETKRLMKSMAKLK
jgi:hypothetical protein